jgi:hypothetical protein
MQLFASLRTRHAAGVALAVVTALAFVVQSAAPTSADPPKGPQVSKVPVGGPPMVLDAKGYIQGFVDFCNQSKPGYFPNTAGLVMVSNRPDANQDATYTEAALSVVMGSKKLQTTANGGKMSDVRYFNNKRWSKPAQPGQLFGDGPFPFDPSAADHPTLALDAATGKATLPGGVTVNLQYSNGVLYGQASTGEMFVITLKKIAGQKVP